MRITVIAPRRHVADHVVVADKPVRCRPAGTERHIERRQSDIPRHRKEAVLLEPLCLRQDLRYRCTWWTQTYWKGIVPFVGAFDVAQDALPCQRHHAV